MHIIGIFFNRPVGEKVGLVPIPGQQGQWTEKITELPLSWPWSTPKHHKQPPETYIYINTHPQYSLFDLKSGTACNSETLVTLPTSAQIQRCKRSKLGLKKKWLLVWTLISRSQTESFQIIAFASCSTMQIVQCTRICLSTKSISFSLSPSQFLPVVIKDMALKLIFWNTMIYYNFY